MMFPFYVDAVEGSISAESETSLFSKNDPTAWRQCGCASFGRFFFMSVIFPLGMDVTFCSFSSLAAGIIKLDIKDGMQI